MNQQCVVAEPTTEPQVYLAGPMTGLPEFNYPAFHRATDRLSGLGFSVFNPAAQPGPNGEVFDPTGMTGTEKLSTDVFDIRAAFAIYTTFITTQADAVMVLAGWEDSRGARAEVALAHAIGLPVYDADSLLLIPNSHTGHQGCCPGFTATR